MGQSPEGKCKKGNDPDLSKMSDREILVDLYKMVHQHSTDINDIRDTANQASTTATSAMEAVTNLQGQVDDIKKTITKNNEDTNELRNTITKKASTMINKDSDRGLRVIFGGLESEIPEKDIIQQMTDILNEISVMDNIDSTFTFSDPGNMGIAQFKTYAGKNRVSEKVARQGGRVEEWRQVMVQKQRPNRKTPRGQNTRAGEAPAYEDGPCTAVDPHILG